MDAQDLIDGCLLNTWNLNGWEHDFIDDIQDQLGNGEELTERQMNKLMDIHSRVTRL
ncbi:hypothetical protein SAMN05216302_101139 [Nitrosomonas aestuarii]|uniref:Uncharacterized protein n=1 Tax=Nitrosomonas aestuarii TaxID=52441 RepID=A0A1I4B4Y2_9PROT|nr:hypothetical protein [Nitrosomonas aestuarii]SFK63928.1 hypothetical protein SAMN05216302_101139 [Nitrosomonas aestuarii]